MADIYEQHSINQQNINQQNNCQQNNYIQNTWQQNNHIVMQVEAPEMVSPYTETLRTQFGTLGLGSILFACFYALCLYKNLSGVTYPFFLGGSLWFFYFCMKKLGISLKKGSFFYMVSILMLGLSTFLTNDDKIIFFNHIGSFILIMCFLLHQLYQVKNWSFGRYLGYLFAVVFGSLGELARPFQDMIYSRKKHNKNGKGKLIYILIGLCIGIPLLVIIWLLLLGADQIFNSMTEKLFRGFDLINILGIIGTIVMMFFMTYCIMAFLCKKQLSDEVRKPKQVESILYITITLPLTILYVSFSSVQIFCLFMQNIDLEKYTYAEYARQGFFQLLTVCLINLVLVLIGKAYFKNHTVLKTILTIMSVCTLVMIFSSAYRMILYIEQYCLTFLRILVLWFLMVLLLVFIGVVISIYYLKFPLFQYNMVIVTLCYLCLSFAHPDCMIAKYNVEHYKTLKETSNNGNLHFDYGYLSKLSMDAAPVLKEFLKEEGFDMETVSSQVNKGMLPHNNQEARSLMRSLKEHYGGTYAEENSWGYYYLRKIIISEKTMSIWDFNLSRYIAQKILQNY